MASKCVGVGRDCGVLLECHWRGAAGTTTMTRIAVTEFVDVSVVTWQERVPEEDYLAA
jgi:hypothetical protein